LREHHLHVRGPCFHRAPLGIEGKGARLEITEGLGT
jgi:hypothetical protein